MPQPNLHTAANRYRNRAERHTTRRGLRAICKTLQEHTKMQDETLFPDLGLRSKKEKPPESGLLDFPATYDTTPAHVTQPAGPLASSCEHGFTQACKFCNAIAQIVKDNQ